jgi:thioesterase domain-containing protein
VTGYYAQRLRDDLEAAVAEAYAEELGVGDLTPRAGLADLGGDDAAAVRIAVRVHRATGTPITADTLRKLDTVERVGAHLRTRTARESCVQLAADARPGVPNLFYLHSASGNAFAIRTLRRHLPVPLAGVRAAGLNGEREVPRTIDEFADAYLPDILRAQPDGPYLLCGFSTGGVIALELARRLRAVGADVGLVAMFDCEAPNPRLPDALPSEEELKRGRLAELLRRVGGTSRPDAAATGDGVVDALRRSHALAEGMDAAALDRQLLVFARSWRAERLYAPARYDGEAHLFETDIAVGHGQAWLPHVPRLRVHRVDAEHYEYAIFADPTFRARLRAVVGTALATRAPAGRTEDS